jgi:hypothetical protein
MRQHTLVSIRRLTPHVRQQMKPYLERSLARARREQHYAVRQPFFPLLAEAGSPQKGMYGRSSRRSGDTHCCIPPLSLCRPWGAPAVPTPVETRKPLAGSHRLRGFRVCGGLSPPEEKHDDNDEEYETGNAARVITIGVKSRSREPANDDKEKNHKEEKTQRLPVSL